MTIRKRWQILVDASHSRIPEDCNYNKKSMSGLAICNKYVNVSYIKEKKEIDIPRRRRTELLIGHFFLASLEACASLL